MTTITHELAALPEAAAVHHHTTSHNVRMLRQFAIGCAALALVFVVMDVLQARYEGLWAPVVLLMLAQWTFVSAERPLVARHLSWLLPLTVLGLLLLVGISVPRKDAGLRLLGLVGAAVAVPFRWRIWQVIVVFGGLCLGTLVIPVLDAWRAGEPQPWVRILLQTVVAVAAATLSLQEAVRDRRRFAREHRVESSRYRDRERMRDELDSARQIQLSMLPRRDPKVAGLEIASVSLPATEVGGDYYDYFVEDGERLTIVVADVAGHGVASGLQLSGMRSCFYLLDDQGLPPLAVAERLARMVRRTSDRRTFITFLLVRIDPGARSLHLVAAGHPPMLHFQPAAGTVTEVGEPAPPLGTRLPAVYREDARELLPGDVIVLYTDGLTESTDRGGEFYGDERLKERLRRVALNLSARDIREALLSDVWTHKGDSEQHDDITLVVVRVP